MIDLCHPLAVLANRMPWQEIEASLSQRWARQIKAGKRVDDLDLFGPVSTVSGGGISNAGQPRLPTRLMVAPLYLKHAFNKSDEDVIHRCYKLLHLARDTPLARSTLAVNSDPRLRVTHWRAI